MEHRNQLLYHRLARENVVMYPQLGIFGRGESLVVLFAPIVNKFRSDNPLALIAEAFHREHLNLVLGFFYVFVIVNLFYGFLAVFVFGDYVLFPLVVYPTGFHHANLEEVVCPTAVSVGFIVIDEICLYGVSRPTGVGYRYLAEKFLVFVLKPLP